MELIEEGLHMLKAVETLEDGGFAGCRVHLRLMKICMGMHNYNGKAERGKALRGAKAA